MHCANCVKSLFSDYNIDTTIRTRSNVEMRTQMISKHLFYKSPNFIMYTIMIRVVLHVDFVLLIVLFAQFNVYIKAFVFVPNWSQFDIHTPTETTFFLMFGNCITHSIRCTFVNCLYLCYYKHFYFINKDSSLKLEVLFC